MNIPARYCAGYLGDIGVPPSSAPMDFSGWFEAYLGGAWYTFDPRHNVPRIGRIVIARGRDAADVAIITTFGPTQLESFRVWTDEVVSSTAKPAFRRCTPSFEAQGYRRPVHRAARQAAVLSTASVANTMVPSFPWYTAGTPKGSKMSRRGAAWAARANAPEARGTLARQDHGGRCRDNQTLPHKGREALRANRSSSTWNQAAAQPPTTR